MTEITSDPMATVPKPQNSLLSQPIVVLFTDNGGFFIRGMERHDGNLVPKQYIATDVDQAVGYIRAMLEYMITN